MACHWQNARPSDDTFDNCRSRTHRNDKCTKNFSNNEGDSRMRLEQLIAIRKIRKLTKAEKTELYGLLYGKR